jgi:hypothetical protein
MKKRMPDKLPHDNETEKDRTPAQLAPLNENGGASADFTPHEIAEFRTALHNSEYMIRRRLRHARDRLLGREERET